MRIEDIIVGSKKRRNRNSRLQRLVQPDNLYTPNPKKLSEAARIQHVEDLILWNGSEGAKRSLMTLRKMESSPVMQLSNGTVLQQLYLGVMKQVSLYLQTSLALLKRAELNVLQAETILQTTYSIVAAEQTKKIQHV